MLVKSYEDNLNGVEDELIYHRHDLRHVPTINIKMKWKISLSFQSKGYKSIMKIEL